MTLDEIQNLLWWHPNTFSAKPGHYAYRDSLGGHLAFNKQVLSSVEQFSATHKNEFPVLNFTLDCGEYHMEDLTPVPPDRSPQHYAFNVPSIWSVPRNCRITTLPSYLSLRVLGYLVDCWETDLSWYVGENIILTHRSAKFTSVMGPVFRSYQTDHNICGKYVRATYDTRRRYANDQHVRFFYYTERPRDAQANFLQHHRNFFLSMARLKQYPRHAKMIT